MGGPGCCEGYEIRRPDNTERNLQFFLHPEESWTLGYLHAERQDKSGMVVQWEYQSCDEDGNSTGLSASIRDLESQCAPVVEGSLNFVQDLLSLPYLHDSVLLQHVRQNYFNNIIYTNIGPIVLALNPFDFGIPHYQDINMPKYIEEGPSVLRTASKQRTHVWSVAHQAYWSMMKNDKPQSILVSGESGAGKTEAAKMVIKYLAACSTHWATESDKANASEIIEKIIKCSPILEAFGNAKTVRNDNSSRFGKFMKLQFTADGLLCGAFTYNYLLEKSRVVSHGVGERSYHSFYQLLAGASDKQRDDYQLHDLSKFGWLYRGTPLIEQDRHDDAQAYLEVRGAMDILGLTSDEQEAVYRVIAGILHFQTIEFTEDREGHAVLSAPNREIVDFVASKLWLVDADRLAREITEQTTARYTRPLKRDQAIDARDGISKVLYKEMFEWLIAKMNSLLSHDPDKPSRWLGLLDIFGFENFEFNSFEQLCINYANESLQNHYNSVVFARDMQECQAEGIEMSFIDAPDNQSCLDLMDSREKMGLFTLLDDQSKAQGSDEKFLDSIREKHYQKRREHPNLIMPRIQDSTFTVKHFAAEVQYSVKGFQAKNMDPLADGVKSLFNDSKCPLIQSLLPEPEEMKAKGKKLRTVSGFFKDNMTELMDTIHQSSPFWIRCVKPHHSKKPRMFQGNEVMMQLRSAGVLETVKIRQCGYPWRLTHHHFWSMFKVLLADSEEWSDNEKTGCQHILQSMHFDKLQAQVGASKVFLKEASYAHLEALRGQRLGIHATLVQRFAHVKIAHWICLCNKMRLDAINIQRFAAWKVSQHILRKKELLRHQHRIRTAILLQREFRARISNTIRCHRHILLVRQQAAVTVQSFGRAALAVHEVQCRQQLAAAVKLQASCRSRLAVLQRGTKAEERRRHQLEVAAFIERCHQHPKKMAVVQAFAHAHWSEAVVQARRQRHAMMEADMFMLGLAQSNESDEEWVPPAQFTTRDPQLLQQYVRTLAKELHSKRKECNTLKKRLEEEHQHRSDIEAQLSSFGAGLCRPQPPLGTDLATLQHQLTAKTEEVFNARLLVRQREEELINLKKACHTYGTEDSSRSEAIKQVTEAIQCHCVVHKEIPAAPEPWDGSEVLEHLRDVLKALLAVVPDDSDDAPATTCVRQYYNHVLALQQQLERSDIAAFLGPILSGSHLQEPLNELSEALKLFQEVSEVQKTTEVKDAGKSEEQRLDAEPWQFTSMDLDPDDSKMQLQLQIHRIEAEINLLRETAQHAVKLKPTTAEQDALLNRLQALQTLREGLAEEQEMLRTISRDFDGRQNEREVNLVREIGQVTEAVTKQRQVVSERRKALEEDIAKLMKWEVQKAKVYKDYQNMMATRADVESLISPLAREVQLRMDATFTATAFLSRQKRFIDDISALTQQYVEETKSTIYSKLGRAHADLWVSCKSRWDVLECKFLEQCAVLETQMALQAFEEGSHLPAPCTSNTLQTMLDTRQMLANQQQEFEQIVDYLKKFRTYSFLSSDPKLQAIVTNNFLAKDFWRFVPEPPDDLR